MSDKRLECRSPVLGEHRLVALKTQDAIERLADLLIIFGNKDGGHVALSGGSCGIRNGVFRVRDRTERV